MTPERSVPTLVGLIAWLERQPPLAKFDWTTPCDCALGRWVAEEFAARPDPGESFQYHTDDGRVLNLEAFDFVAIDGRATYGAALGRARTALAKAHPATPTTEEG